MGTKGEHHGSAMSQSLDKLSKANANKKPVALHSSKDCGQSIYLDTVEVNESQGKN